jgi:hypothetical protein
LWQAGRWQSTDVDRNGGQYVLDNFVTVTEAVDALRQQPFAIPSMPNGSSAQLHPAISARPAIPRFSNILADLLGRPSGAATCPRCLASDKNGQRLKRTIQRLVQWSALSHRIGQPRAAVRRRNHDHVGDATTDTGSSARVDRRVRMESALQRVHDANPDPAKRRPPRTPPAAPIRRSAFQAGFLCQRDEVGRADYAAKWMVPAYRSLGLRNRFFKACEAGQGGDGCRGFALRTQRLNPGPNH